MKVCVCVEQYDVLGVLPSQLESLALVATAMGITELVFVDGTMDGVFGTGITRYATYDDFFAATTGPYVHMDPNGDDIRTATVAPDSWLVFSPSMGGLNDYTFDQSLAIPGGVLNARDAIPIAAWETSSWREQ